VLQYGQGTGSNLVLNSPSFNPGKTSNGNSKQSWRLIDTLVWSAGPTDGQAVIIYQDQKENYKWFSFGVRPVYHFNDLYGITAEYGFDQVKPDNANMANGSIETTRLQKFTVAGLVTSGKGFWNRPQLRLFYTYAVWNDAARDSTWGNVGGAAYANSTSGSTYGAQAEIWW